MGLRDFDATILVDDAFTSGQVSRGTLGGANIINAGVQLGNSEVGQLKSSLLRINASVESSISQTVNILANSTLASNIGALANWGYGGNFKLRLPCRSR